MTTLIRESNETTVRVQLHAATGPKDDIVVNTSHAFLDHMLNTLARYAGLALHIEASGDLRHHLVEDVAITLGRALRGEIPDACIRYGHAVVPMDDALVVAAIDVGGRAWYDGRLPSSLFEHFFRSLAHNSESTLHLRVLRGRDRHHVVEAAFKALGLALRAALQRQGAVFSTKGAVVLRRDKNG
jgi:imidazoleglycerol-phosphate dehydratase